MALATAAEQPSDALPLGGMIQRIGRSAGPFPAMEFPNGFGNVEFRPLHRFRERKSSRDISSDRRRGRAARAMGGNSRNERRAEGLTLPVQGEEHIRGPLFTQMATLQE